MICGNKECAKDFTAKTHNQKYCSDECCRIATNRRIMEKYYEKKAIRSGAHRNCKKCNVKLSRYNQKDICSTCEKNIGSANKKALWDIVNEIG